MISYAPRSSNPHCIQINSKWLEAVGMDVPTTLKTWTVMETLLGGIGFLFALAGWWLL